MINDGGYMVTVAYVIAGYSDDWIFEHLNISEDLKNRKVFNHQIKIIRERLDGLREEIV